MKQVTLSIGGTPDPKSVARSIGELSGVMAVQMNGGQAVAHCGERLNAETLISAASRAGVDAHVISERLE